jgi:hypothetical protein
MAVVGSLGSPWQSHNVISATWDTDHYVIELAFGGMVDEYVVLLATYDAANPETIVYSWLSGNLIVRVFDSAGNEVQSTFSLCVLRMS